MTGTTTRDDHLVIVGTQPDNPEGGSTPMMKVALAAAAVFAMSTAAHAAVIASLASVTPDGSNYLYSYTEQLPANQGLVAGDQLVIVDFQGYVAGSISSSSPYWTASVVYTLPAGLTLPSGQTDNPSIPDLVFTYTGPSFHASGGPFPGVTDIAGLTAESTFGTSTSGFFVASSVQNVGGNAGVTIDHSSSVGVPSGVGAPSGVPEPATWAMLLLGFLGIGALARSKSRNSVNMLAA